MNGADPGGHEETGAADRQSTAGTQRIDGRQTARAARHAGHPPGRHQQPEGAPLRFFFTPPRHALIEFLIEQPIDTFSFHSNHSKRFYRT